MTAMRNSIIDNLLYPPIHGMSTLDAVAFSLGDAKWNVLRCLDEAS